MVAVEFKRKTQITNETGLHSSWPDFWDGMGSLYHNATSDGSGITGPFTGTSATGFFSVRGGETPIKYLCTTQVADQPSYGAAKLKRLDLNYFVNKITFGASPDPHMMAAYKVFPNTGYTGEGRLDIVADEIVAMSGTATKENVAWAENFTGSDFIEDAGLYENIHRVTKEVSGNMFMSVSDAHKQARWSKNGMKMSKGVTAMNTGGSRGRGMGGSGAGQNSTYYSAMTEKSFRSKYCSMATNAAQMRSASSSGGINTGFRLSMKVCHVEKSDEGHWQTTKTHNSKRAYFTEADIKSKLLSGHTAISNTTEGYGNEVTPANTRFKIVTGSTEYIEDETEDEAAKVHGVARSRFSSKKVLRNSQSMEMLAIWNYNNPDLCNYELGASKRNIQQTMVSLDGVLPIPTNPFISSMKAMGISDGDITHNSMFPLTGSSVCVDINIEKMAWAFKFTQSSDKFAVSERAFVITMSGSRRPKYNETFYEYVDAHCGTPSNEATIASLSSALTPFWGWAFMRRGSQGDTSTDSTGDISVFDAIDWRFSTGAGSHPDRIYVPATTTPEVAGFPGESWVRLKIMSKWQEADMKVQLLSVDKSGNDEVLEIGSNSLSGYDMKDIHAAHTHMSKPSATAAGAGTDDFVSATASSFTRGTTTNGAPKYLSLWVLNTRCQNNGTDVDTLVEDINDNSSNIESEAVILDSNFDCITKVFVDSISLRQINWNHSNATIGEYDNSRLVISTPQECDALFNLPSGVSSVSDENSGYWTDGPFHMSFGFENITDIADDTTASPKYLMLNDFKTMTASNSIINTDIRGITWDVTSEATKRTTRTQAEAPNGWIYAYHLGKYKEIALGCTSAIFDQHVASGNTMPHGHQLLGREVELSPTFGVDNFSQKGFIRYNFADASFVKRENHFCAAKILRVVDYNAGIFEVDNTDIFKNYNSTKYIAYLWGAPRAETDSGTNLCTRAIDITLIDILGPRRVQLEWDGYSEADHKKLTSDSFIGSLWISPYLYWVGFAGWNAKDSTDPSLDSSASAPSIAISEPLAEKSYSSALVVEPITQNGVAYDLEMTLADTTPSPSGAFSTVADEWYYITQTSTGTTAGATDGNGTGAIFDIDASTGAAPVITVVSPGQDYAKGDFIRLTDPGASSNTVDVVVQDLAAVNNKFIVGATYNETEFTEPTTINAASYLKPWNHEITDENTTSILDTKDYGFGGLTENEDSGNFTGGHAGEELAVADAFNTIKMHSVVSAASVETSDYIDFILMTKNNNITHDVQIRGIADLYATGGAVITPVYGDYKPFLTTVFEDEQPSVPVNFKVGPWSSGDDEESETDIKVNPFLPMFTWEVSDSDLWYGILHIDDKAISHQYHQAMAHIPLNEINKSNNALIATSNTYPPKAYPYRHTAAASYTVAAVNASPRITVEGLAGNAVYFPGSGAELRFSDNSVSIDGAGGNPTTGFTVLAHVIPDTGSTAGTIVAKGLNMHLAGGFDYMLSMTATNTIEAKIAWNATSYVKVTSSTKIIRDGETPTMVALVLDTELKSGNVKLYINGILEDQTGVRMTTPVGTSDSPFTAYNNWKTGESIQYGTAETYIGGNASHSVAADFIGIIEEVVIWDRPIYFVAPEDNSFILHKPLKENVAGDSGSSKSYNARLFIKDYHNIRGKSNEDVTCTSQISWRKAGFRVAG